MVGKERKRNIKDAMSCGKAAFLKSEGVEGRDNQIIWLLGRETLALFLYF